MFDIGFDIGKELKEAYEEGYHDRDKEIVRCKECRYWQEQEEGIVECSVCTRIHDMVFEMGEYDYCSKGKRRERREDGEA